MIEFDLRQPRHEESWPLGDSFSGSNGRGGTVAFSNQSMLVDGKPFFGITGEIHYCRISPDQWEDTLLKARCGGINTVTTYVFWNVHEEEQGSFRFDGCRDLRRFVSLCGELGLMVILRIGPFAHGEMRNGGMPDWLYGMPFEVRGNDPAYLRYVRRFYGAIHGQVKGLYYGEGGPVVGIQLQNEYMHSSAPWEITTGVAGEWVNGGSDGEEHIRQLKQIAREEGLITPFYTCTAWGGAMAPVDEVLPLWGGYAYWPWIFYNRTGTHPCTPEYIYRDNHHNAVRKTYNFEPRYAPEDMPYACCEMMGGMMCSYNYRFTLPFESVDALANVKLGSGCALLGYYMYKGGTNPTGQRTPFLNEGQVSKRSYDYQAPIGEYGQRRTSYYRLRTLHDFCASFQERLLGSVTLLADDRDDMAPEDTRRLRCCVRYKDGGGFLFVNNFQDHLDLPDRHHDRVRMTLPDQTLDFDISIASGENAILPFRFPMEELMLLQATVQPITRLTIGGQLCWFFMMPDGMAPELRFRVDTVRSVTGITGDRLGEALVLRPEHRPVIDLMVNEQRILLLSRHEATRFSHISVDGRDMAILSDTGVLWDGKQAVLEDDGTPQQVLTLPPMGGASEFAGSFGGVTFSGRDEPLPELQVAQVGPTRWTLDIPQAVLSGDALTLLRVHYMGNIGQAFINGQMISDNFCNGQHWEIRLDPYAAQLAQHPLTLYIVPVKQGASVSVDSTMAARMEKVEGILASLDQVSLRRIHRRTISLM